MSELLQRYADFRPTSFDPAGLARHRMGYDDDDCDRSSWLVCPTSQTRDSGTLAQSNYAQMLAALEECDPEGEHHEEHRFGHWACGWFEVIIVRPDSPAQKVAEDAASALADYPILNDEDHSERESEEQVRDWHSFAREDFIKEMLEAYPALVCERCEGNGWTSDERYRAPLEQARKLYRTIAHENGMANYGSSCDLAPVLARIDYFRALFMPDCEPCEGEGNHLASVDADALLSFAMREDFICEYYSDSGFYFACEGYKEWDAQSIREALKDYQS